VFGPHLRPLARLPCESLEQAHGCDCGGCICLLCSHAHITQAAASEAGITGGLRGNAPLADPRGLPSSSADILQAADMIQACGDNYDSLASTKAQSLDREKLMGTWKEVASRNIPFFSDSCKCSTWDLRAVGDQGTYTVDFECQNEAWWSFLSPRVRIPSTSAVEWAGPPGKMTQVLFGKLQMPYWVLEYRGDYEQALVYRCVQVGPFKQEFIHFLSRDAMVPDEIRLDMARYATGVVINMSLVRHVPMDSCVAPIPEVHDDIPDVSAVKHLQVHADPLVNCTGDDGNSTDCTEIFVWNYTEISTTNYFDKSTESPLTSSTEISNDLQSVSTTGLQQELPSTSQFPSPGLTIGSNQAQPLTWGELVPAVVGVWPHQDCPAMVNMAQLSINSSAKDRWQVKRARWFGSYNKTTIPPGPIFHGGRPIYSGPHRFHLFYGSEQRQWMIGLNYSMDGMELGPWVTGLNKDTLCPEQTKHGEDSKIVVTNTSDKATAGNTIPKDKTIAGETVPHDRSTDETSPQNKIDADESIPQLDIKKDIKKQMEHINKQLEGIKKDIKKHSRPLKDIRQQLQDTISAPPPSSEVAPIFQISQESLDDTINISALPEIPEIAQARKSLKQQMGKVIARTRSRRRGTPDKKYYAEFDAQSV